MMPLALGLLWLELQILERLTIPVETMQMRPIGGPAGGRSAAVVRFHRGCGDLATTC